MASKRSSRNGTKDSGGKASATGRKRSARGAGKSRTRAKQPAPTRSASGRALWSGNLRLALVSVPVKLFAASQEGDHVSFHQIHEPSGKRVRYEKVVPGIGPIDTDDIVKGFEIEKGRYVLIDPEEIDALKLEAKHTLDLVQFVEHGEIDPIWFDRPYYVVADGELAEEAYGVLRDSLRANRRIGLGQFVMRGREYIGAIKACGKGLLLETLRFADEVRNAAPFFAEMDAEQADADLLALAKDLIDRKTAPFDPSSFRDQYATALRELVAAKAADRKPVEVDEERPAGDGKVVDLFEALKRSVNAGDRSQRDAAPARRRA
jgi:DNA end-binding protein Ku